MPDTGVSALTPQMRDVLERLLREDAGLPDPTTLPAGEGRALAERTNRRWNVDLPAMVEVRDVGLASGMAGRVLVPANDEGRGAILYIHGGGWAFCSKETHERAARVLAIAAGAPVVTFDHRSAPEHPYPEGLDDCIAAWQALGSIFPNRRLGVAGDSSGANLAVAATLRLQAEKGRAPDVGLLFYGVYDDDFYSPSYRLYAEGPGLTRAKMQRYWAWYQPVPARRSDPLISPLKASDSALRALPPLYLIAAGQDPLRSDSERFHARLSALGRADTLRIFEGVVHGFMQMSSVLSDALTATEEAGAAFRKAVNTK
ncbi:alpha/beta hydrolase [Shumkonia mesophila]|uniref:alpha/beta hydrolase n=1 Tax=Shumkonia mesophila TaxID=2838854 RepID=UPI0029342E29|nr:alpha/beta hydrolase [Shumkonia mesophila]